MSASLYGDKTEKPDERLLRKDLESSFAYYKKIHDYIETEYDDIKTDWKYYGKKSGWILKLLNRKRNVLFLIPCSGYFQVAFTFGDKAAEVIINSDLPESIRKDTAQAKKYAEGRTIKLDVRNENDVKNVLELIKIKLAN